VYGEVGGANVAHSQKLAAKVPEQELDKVYRSEKVLTMALMGLLAADMLIGRFLGSTAPLRAEQSG